MPENISPIHIAYFQNAIGSQYVILPNADIEKYTHDYTEDLKYTPALALLPANEIEISAILKYCNQHLITVTPRGAGTGLSGGFEHRRK
jgi:glycolate oxidase